MQKLRSILLFHPALWGLVVLQALVIAAWFAIDPRVSFSPANGAAQGVVLGGCLLVAIVAYACRQSRWSVAAERARVIATGIIFLMVAFTAIRFINHLTMSLAFPLADDLLDSWDRALGLDWYAYATGIGQYPEILPYIREPYIQTALAPPVLFLLLAMFGKIERAKVFAALLVIGGLITTVIAGFFPAEAAMVRYMDDRLLSAFGSNAGVYHMGTLTMLRESQHIILSFQNLPGLATFPSFHTMVGVLVVYACRDNLLALLLAAAWSGAMILATPVYGGHYFIDIIAGFLLTLLLAAAYAAIKNAHLAAPGMVATDPAR